MRTVDPILHAALMEGKGKPKILAYVGYADGTVKYSVKPIAYKLTGTTLEIEMPKVSDIGGDQVSIWLERGVTIGGVDYTITTSRFYIASQEYRDDQTQLVIGNLFPKKKYTSPGDGTYEASIELFCIAYGKTAAFRNYAEPWLAYQYLPDGKQIIMNDANHFLNQLIQKYLVHACDNGGEEVLFYSADVMGAADETIPVKDAFHVSTTNLRTRQFMWKDESQSLHLDGGANDPIHNLGYLESTCSPPARHAPTFEATAILRPDLRIQDGDVVTLQFYNGGDASFFAHPIEIYDPRGSTRPEWRVQLEANPVFHNTEAGALPSTIERVSNYTPLSTGTFDGILSASDNNLQAAMETIDEHHASLPILAADTWTPSLTNTTNISSSVAHPCQYMRIGNRVICFGVVEINPTGAGACVLKMTLPIASNFVNTEDADGNFTSPNLTPGSIIPDGTLDKFDFRFTAAGAGNVFWRFVAGYVIN